MIKSGITNTITISVSPDDTARKIGSGSLDVLATPAMIAGMENVCMTAISSFLENGSTTVGTFVEISHISATPVGESVTYTCTLTEVNGRELVFTVVASDSFGKIGEGIHKRFIVNEEKFMLKVNSKIK